jgi:signal transduction histidine kinase
MRNRLQKRGHEMLVGLGLIPLLLGGASLFTSYQHRNSAANVTSAEEITRELEELLSTLKDAETGQRGYLLTQRTQYLNPFFSAQPQLNKGFARLKQNPFLSIQQKQRLGQLERLVKAKTMELQLTINLGRATGLDAALAIVDTNRGQEMMERIRALTAEMIRDERATLRASLADQQQSEEHLNWVLTIGTTLVFVLFFLANGINRKYVQERDRAETEIRNLNGSLEARIRERTASLEQTTEELSKKAAELEQSTTQLRRSNADLKSFSYVASHDLQEPLRMISSYTGLIDRRYRASLDEEGRQYLKYVVDGAIRMRTLIEDLLVYSQSGTQILKKSKIPMRVVVENALANLRLVMEETSARVDYRADLPDVDADANKLTQVIQNLVGNAIKFRKPEVPPEISISAEKGDTGWRFAIRDNGIGFDPQYTERVFMTFQRLHGIERYQGNGIGLAICKRIIEHHGGRLWAESTPGEGSTFFFTLPLAPRTEKSEDYEYKLSC